VETATIVAVGAVFVAAWMAANRRHLARREQQSSEWTGEAQRPDLWTSGAACVHCGATGGLLELRGDGAQYTCLACGRTHVRQTRA
jgi:hypothetical protein